MCYLPRELRVRLFDVVFDLRRKGLAYSEIVGWVQKKYGVRLSKSHVSYWTRGIHSPYNGRYIPSIDLLRPSEELAYVIGVILGDGYANKKRHAVKSYNYIKIGLEVKDREFAVEFARCLAKVLGRHPIEPRYWKRYVVEVGSKTLYELLKKPVNLDGLKNYVEHCGRCTAAFIRGFFDSEGCVEKRGYIYIVNTNLQLLTYVKALLHCLGIITTEPRICIRQGAVCYNPRTGKRYKTKKDCYIIYIRTGSNITFYRKVGFTIQRKQKRLEEYLKRRQSQTPSPLSHPFFKNQ